MQAAGEAAGRVIGIAPSEVGSALLLNWSRHA
jgi:hypothetical protein